MSKNSGFLWKTHPKETCLLPSNPKLAGIDFDILSAEERQDLIDYLAEHPKAGDVMEGTGGVRKLRWRRGGQGKSGGVRIVYYYHDDLMPLYLLTIFAKGDKANLTEAERNELAGLVDVLVNIWKGRAKP
ncbi:type II toxin-antitoxin system RelE/ParE family toxin [Castellaniella hirudinis]|uniref:type II toxin-antitoxin system RelE/ParE family toxin n=1 Tax=Castellaniella hirudinis TaxID=1144617 RepID=UPI0039C076BD